MRPLACLFSIFGRLFFALGFQIDVWIMSPPCGAPFGVPWALWGRPLAHFGLQDGALGTSLGPFGAAQGPLGVDLGDLG